MADPQQLTRRLGSMQQVASVRPILFCEGRAEYTHAYAIKNGPLHFLVMADKCMDISECSYKGVNINFLSKPGLTGRNHYDTHGTEALRSIMGGLFFTCGLENICPPCNDKGKEFPMHGRLRSTPAEHLCADAFWEDGSYILRVSGEMREAELFGENMTLRRTIETVYGSRSILIKDHFQNNAFRDEIMMLLYHFNVGYPLLDEGTELVLPSLRVTPRDKSSERNLSGWNGMDAPEDNMPEEVFIHELAADAQGNTFAALVNDQLEMGILLEFNQRYLPRFMQWKSTASGDYVMGLEPANASVFGRLQQKQEGFHMLPPSGEEEICLKVTILDGEKELAGIRKQAGDLLSKYI